MATEIIASIPDAMKNLENLRDCYSEYEDKIFLRLLMHKLRGLRTFLLCLKKTDSAEDSSVEKGPESDILETDSAVEDCPEESDLLENEGSSENTEESQLESLLERLADFVAEIEENDYYEYLFDIESFEEELDQWYTSLSDYLLEDSNSPVAIEVEDIFNSVLENLEDFLSLHMAYVGDVVAPVEALKVNITFWRNFLRFASFLGTDKEQEFQDLMRSLEGLAFSAAHFTLHIFSARHYNIKVFSESERNLRVCHEDGQVFVGSEYLQRIDALHSPHSYETSYERVRSTVSALLLEINPLDNARLYESYTVALKSLKSSRESHVTNLDIEGSNSILLFTLWEVLQFQSGPAVAMKHELQKLYEGLRFLSDLLKKFDGNVGAIARAGIFDAGVIVFSIYQNTKAIDHEVEDFLGAVNLIQTHVEEKVVVNTSKINFPKTTVLAFLDFLLNYLMEVEISDIDSEKPSCVRRVREYILLLRSFMEKLVKLKSQPEDLHQDTWIFAVEVAYKIELLIDQLVLGDILDSDLMSLNSITEDVKVIKTDSERIFDVGEEEPDEEVTLAPADKVISYSSISPAHDFVGFEDEQREITDRLTRGSKKLQVVAIVGMPGLGKTTLATKVYNEPSVKQHFSVRAWCSISQDFNKRKVLLELLNQIPGSKPDLKMTDDELAQVLRRSLLRRRYLICLDDVWEIEAFQCFKLIFPDDSSGRILLTSRIGDVAKLDDKPHFLRQLKFSESLELLRRKAAFGKEWPPSLHDIAVKIAENCKGLPLLIIIVAGLLATAKKEVWEEVLESLSSGIISSTDQCEKTIELSYKHLPEHLKPCLLSFGGFPEDEEISVKRLIWLWISEGVVRKSESRSLEEVAVDYLKNLIGRSLVMDGKKRTGGGIKTCRIHDLLLDFCVRKAIEENALHLLKGKEEISHFEESRYLRRLCVHSKMGDFMESKLYCPQLRSLSFFGEKRCDEVTDISFIFRIFKLLRVLNMERVRISSYDFPGGIGLLVHLRYLAITVTFDVSPSVGNLSNLETFILHPVHGILVTMPDTFWNLRKLRHLLLNYREDEDDLRGVILPVHSSCKFLDLESLSGLHSQNWCIMENHLNNFPNIRRLKCWLYEFGSDGSKVMSFSFLSRLESLTLSFDENSTEFEFIFPQNIKKLHLSSCRLSWEKVSRIAELPNLEVLKLFYDCFIGGKWQMEEGEFSKLRFLKLMDLELINWTGCDYQFPNLEKLVVERCDELEEIPECLDSVDTLEMIEVINCSDHLVSLFETLADNLIDTGNSVLQLHVRPSKKIPTSEPGSADDEDEDSANEEDEDSVTEEDDENSANEEAT